VWAVVVINQGYPVQLTLVSSQDDLDEAVKRARLDWRLDHLISAQVMEKPVSSFTENVQVRSITLYVDSPEDPKYFLAVVPRVKIAKSQSTAKQWQFCPECGCSWLHHLAGPASLSPEEWDSCPCSECGCEKAMNP
jgi:hypothetical protein